MSLKKFFKEIYSRLRFRLSSRNSVIFTLFYKYFYHPKKGSLAYYLDSYAKLKKGRVTLIQVGANDGMTHDPVHKFIKRDGWGGVLLEPQKYVFDNFLSKVYSRNKNIVTVNAALGPEDGYLTMYKISFSEERWASGLATFNRDLLREKVESGYIAKKAKSIGIPIPVDRREWIAEEKVEVLSFDTLLQRYALSNVDLLMIDTEGYDYEIIKLIDFKKIVPEIIIFESAHLPEAINRKCREYLGRSGYQFVDTEGSTLCVHHSITELIEAA